jgi:hypothetical protein
LVLSVDHTSQTDRPTGANEGLQVLQRGNFDEAREKIGRTVGNSLERLRQLLVPDESTGGPSPFITWPSNVILMLSVAMNALNIYPLGVILFSIGACGWLYAAIIWRDKVLIFIQTFFVVATWAGLLVHFTGLLD